MKKEEATAFLNPGICPRCEGKLYVASKGLIFKDYSVKCQSCASTWNEYSEFLNEFEEASIETLNKEGLSPWPFEVPVLLRENENAYLVRENVGLYEGRRYTFRSSGVGMSLRLARGVWIRPGISSGSAESEDVMKLLDEGSFVLTNKRIIYVGDRKSIQIPLKQILAVDVKEDGLLYLARERKRRIEAFSMPLPRLTKEFIALAYKEAA